MENLVRIQLIERLAHYPWHCWLKDCPVWADLFAELWTKLPESALRKLVLTTRTLVVLPPVNYGRVIRLQQPFLTGLHILQVDEKLLQRPREEALGILAHELAHLCTPICDNEIENDLQADKLAMEWGFMQGLKQALHRDLDPDHPRVLALLNSVAA